MAIKIKDIPPEGLALELAQKLDLFDAGTTSTAFTAVLSIKPISGNSFHISGRVQSEPLLECSRCLKRFSYPIDTELSADVAPLSAMGTGNEHELAGEELDMEFYRGDELEPLDLVKEQLLISLPMVPVHSPECKGLCPTCGADRNTAPCRCSDARKESGPFSVLKDILKK
jgi:uncharacterized protein